MLGFLKTLVDQTNIVSDILKVGGLVKSKEQELALTSLARLLNNTEDFPASLMLVDAPEQNLAQVIGITAHGKQRDALRRELLARFQKEILNFPAAQTLSEWNIAAGKWFLPRWLKQRGLLKNAFEINPGQRNN
jgi:GMP synthase PP-ATPase subunit